MEKKLKVIIVNLAPYYAGTKKLRGLDRKIEALKEKVIQFVFDPAEGLVYNMDQWVISSVEGKILPVQKQKSIMGYPPEVAVAAAINREEHVMFLCDTKEYANILHDVLTSITDDRFKVSRYWNFPVYPDHYKKAC